MKPSTAFLGAILLAGCTVVDISATRATEGPRIVRQSPNLEGIGGQQGLGLALDALAAGDAEGALYLAQRTAEGNPETPWYKRSLFVIELALIRLDREALAEAAALRVQAEYPELADYGLFLLAEYHFLKTRFTKAAALYQQVAERYPRGPLAPQAAYKQALALLEGALFAPAGDAFEAFLKKYPSSDRASEAGLGLGKVRIAEGRFAEAVRAYLNVFVSYPGNSRDSEVEKALEKLRGQGATIPDVSADEFFQRAGNLFRASQFDKALASYAGALEANPRHPRKADILFRSGIALYNTGKRSEAAKTFEQFARLYPQDGRSAEALNWTGKSYSKLGMRDKAVQAFAKVAGDYPDSEWADDALYLAGNVFRDAGDHRKALAFYRRITAEYPQSSFADSAWWWKAWAAYTTGEYQRAEQVLGDLVKKYPKSFLASQARYWQGRAAEKANDRSRAAQYYQQAVTKGPYTYYGYQASARLSLLGRPLAVMNGEGPATGISEEDADWPLVDPLEDFEIGDAAGPPVWTAQTIKTLSSSAAYKKSLELMVLRMKQEAATELGALQERIPGGHASHLDVSRAFFELGDYHRSITLVLQNYDRYLNGPVRQMPEDLWLLAYPQGFWDGIVTYARRYNQDPYFIAAIIRQESRFHAQAVSPAGARGVMQVMPSTGEWIAQMMGASGFDRAKLYEADTSINFGTWYVSRLMQRFKGDMLLTAAAYNAGPGAVEGWLAKYGKTMDRDEFVESIPYTETRWYVKKVLRNYAEYRRIYATPVRFGMLPVASAAPRNFPMNESESVMAPKQ